MADRNVKRSMQSPAICEVNEAIGSSDNDLTINIAEAEKSMRIEMEMISPRDIQPSIYRVHKKLRDVNEKAYEPVMLAIGPYHRGNKNLQMMEEHKWRYLKALLDNNDLKFENFISAIAEEEQLARKFYAEPVNDITSAKFIEMLVLDGCFIIKVVINFCPNFLANFEPNDPIFHSLWIRDNLIRDMMLFENQIPFFVLCKLFDLILAPNEHGLLIHLVQCFFWGSFPEADATNSTSHDGKRDKLFDRLTGPIFNLFIKKRCPGAGTSSSSVTNLDNLQYDDESQNVMHILDLLHSKWTRTSKINDDDDDDDDDTQVEGGFKFIQCATDLRDANVKFRVSSEHNTMFDIVFNKGTLSIPPLKISDRTECTLRNLIVFEQYFPQNRPTSFTAYARFMDCLINSSADATFLSQRGIIHNWMGDNEVVAKVFNEITDSVSLGTHFAYAKTFRLINKHYHRKKNRALAKLKRNYFNSPWAYISFFAALLLLSLTIAQTVLSALQLG